MTKDEQIEADYKAGRRAHDEGKTRGEFFVSYKHDKHRWVAFTKGYSDATVEENKKVKEGK